jgi:hypothetical protein
MLLAVLFRRRALSLCCAGRALRLPARNPCSERDVESKTLRKTRRESGGGRRRGDVHLHKKHPEQTPPKKQKVSEQNKMHFLMAYSSDQLAYAYATGTNYINANPPRSPVFKGVQLIPSKLNIVRLSFFLSATVGRGGEPARANRRPAP